MTAKVETVATPLGPFAVVVDPSGAVTHAGWFDGTLDAWLAAREVTAEPADLPAAAAVVRYFEDPRRGLPWLELAPEGTAFQQTVWAEVRRIPAGRTRSYGDVARAVGRPRGAQAVGAANGANPVALFVPCHRVVGSQGQLTGYAGGLERKEWLLRHEGGVGRQLGLV